MSPMTRRRFLAAATVVAIGLAAGVAGVRRRRILAWLARPEIAPAPVGPLAAGTSATLLAMARTMLGEPITAATYTDFFEWRAAHLSGHRAVYESFAAHLDAQARRSGAAGFAAAGADVRRRVLAGLEPTRGWRRAGDGLLRRDVVRWRQQVMRETLRLFAHTDAWTRLGYDYAPATPAGLEAAMTPPRGAA
jgi:hypothetical protein